MPRTAHGLLLIALGLAACHASGPAVRSAEEVGVLEQSDAIEGRDGGGSSLAFGRSVWTYGDTVLTLNDEDGRNWLNNSVSRTDDLDASDWITGFVEPLDSVGAPRPLVPATDAEAAFNTAHW